MCRQNVIDCRLGLCVYASFPAVGRDAEVLWDEQPSLAWFSPAGQCLIKRFAIHELSLVDIWNTLAAAPKRYGYDELFSARIRTQDEKAFLYRLAMRRLFYSQARGDGCV